MKREDIRTFLKDGADAIPCEFGNGRLTEFNSKLNNRYPFCWTESISATTRFSLSGASLVDNWSISIYIAKKDAMDSVPSQYEAIIDDCDHIARKLIWQYNDFLYKNIDATAKLSDNTTLKRTAYSKLSISEINRVPFIKENHVDCISGVILSFTLTSPDNTDVC